MIQKTIQILILIGFLSAAALSAHEGGHKDSMDKHHEHGKDGDHSKHKESKKGKETNSGKEHDHSKMKESKGKK
ncbi:hypothetical protein [Leptospira adleri]|uniref:Pentapeptide MXKDX repeat protein n=1 Tax=Leptospira adleri TaxID=2023186 RepID=A0A2M9YTT5_9LEPT|nr:hypothetical protein [Leptospira adleri]PJZ54947.1 hypothetical protein CH380_00030 [Leptospira adleri]PJZ60663.1 hypothetical protein CH376_17340 [Leptospira adleri]